MDIGLLLLRVIVGLLFVGHGTQKLFGWFNGPGIEGTTGMYDQLDYPRPRTMAVLAGTTEAVSGALLTVGLLVPLAAAGIIGVMVNAIVTVHADNGLWNTNGGYEYNLVLSTAAATLAFTGAGAWALDGAIGWDLAGIGWGIGAIALGIVTAAGVLASRETTARPAAATSQEEVEAEERRAA